MRRVAGSRTARSFTAREEGGVTAEFVLAFPIVFFIVLSCFEVGLMNLRRVMLERATHEMVRAVQLDPGRDWQHDDLKTALCGAAGRLYRDCADIVTIELRPIDQTLADWGFLPTTATCQDRAEDVDPPDVASGGGNELMQVRTCAIFAPLFPNLLVGRAMPKDANGDYRMTALSTFVNEPG